MHLGWAKIQRASLCLSLVRRHSLIKYASAMEHTLPVSFRLTVCARMQNHIKEQVYPVLQAVENAPNLFRKKKKVKYGANQDVPCSLQHKNIRSVCSVLLMFLILLSTNRGQQCSRA